MIQKSVLEQARLGPASESLVILNEIPSLNPRGRYQLSIYKSFLKYHGKTYDFKIQTKHITTIFYLPKADNIH